MKLRKILLLLFALFLLVLTGCTKKQEAKNEITAMASFFPMYDFTRNIVAKEGQVSLLIPAGVEPHDFEPSAKDLANLSQQQIFVYNSHYLETWVSKLKKNFPAEKVKMVEAAAGINLIKLKNGAKKTKSADPHVWLSPQRAIMEVRHIQDALCQQYPHKKAQFMKNSTQYIKKLKKLDQKYQQAFKNVKQRKFITQHAAFSYLAKDYHLDQVAITGLSAEEEPTGKRLAELKKYVKANNLKFIYFEENASPKVAKTLAKETDVKTLVLNPLESLSSTKQNSGEDYISIMEKNLKALQKSVY